MTYQKSFQSFPIDAMIGPLGSLSEISLFNSLKCQEKVNPTSVNETKKAK